MYNEKIVSGNDMVYFTSLTSFHLIFRECVNLESVVIPQNVTSLGNYSFALCSKLKELDLHEGLTSIGVWTFQGIQIETIVIPSTVTTMTNPFRKTGVKKLVMKPLAPPNNREDFGGNVPTIIYIPDGSEEAYLSTSNNNLRFYSSRFRPLSEWDGQ